MGLTAAKYAKYRKEKGLSGTSHQAVMKAAAAGRIPQEADGTFDPVKCDRAWEENTRRRGKTKVPLKNKQDSSGKKKKEDIEKEASRLLGMGDQPEGLKRLIEEFKSLIDYLDHEGLSKTDGERLKECYLSLLRKLEYDKRAGSLVEVAPLKKQLFELWRTERDAWLNFPTRYSALIASKFGIDQNQLTIILEKYINEFIDERATQPRIQF